ncbi:hypothetical protein ACFLVW_08140 [Chloroflexota bacterium]
MTEKSKKYPNPKFNSLDEEDQYWKTHSPLDEGYEGEIQKGKEKRSSFLSIRLTAEELSRLRKTAAVYGMGPSTYVRQLIVGMTTPNLQTFPFPPGAHSPFIIPQDEQENVFEHTKEEILKLYDKCSNDPNTQRDIVGVFLEIMEKLVATNTYRAPYQYPGYTFPGIPAIYRAKQEEESLVDKKR